MKRTPGLRRKLAKLRKAPKRFLSDSKHPALRALNILVSESWSAVGAKTVEGGTPLDVRPVIEASGLFDAAFYLNKYPDIRKRRIDPLGHYIKHGSREARLPNSLFDPHHYARQAGIHPHDNPLVHYITVGESKGLQPHPRFDPVVYKTRNPDVEGSKLGLLAHYLKVGQAEGRRILAAAASGSAGLSVEQDLRALAVTILIPVFNNREHVRRCIEAVLARTNMRRAELLLIDDGSSDPATRALLSEYARLPKVTLLSNEKNIGFTRTVNRGIQHAKGRDVVLLNSDTVVGPRWLETLAWVAHGSKWMATATALSDNAGAFSTPSVGSNATHSVVPVHDAARLSQRSALGDVHLVPTGNGFCMYMRRTALDATGLLDEVHFPRGYGEENDWCMRANEHGFRHAIALQAYVHHVNAVSFGAEAKEQLREDARRVIDRLYPDYGMQVQQAFGPETALTQQRQNFADSLDKVRRNLGSTPRPRVLFVVSTRTGGTPLTNEDLMRGVSHLYEPLLLVCDTREVQLIDYSDGRPAELASHFLNEPLTFVPHVSAEYDSLVSGWLTRFGIELLHIRHIGWHSLGLVGAAQRLEIPIVFSFHDFYTMCPSVNLTNGKDAWCEQGVTSPHIVSPLWARRDPKGVEMAKTIDPHAFLALWKRRMNAMLAGCDAFVTTSPSVKQILSDNLPVLRERAEQFHVIPHGRDFEQFLAPARAPKRRQPLRVLLAGNITEPKGLATVLELLELDNQGTIELHLIGTGRESLTKSPRVKNHGSYARKDFNKLVAKIRPHVGFIPTICPETFCHTLTECWAAGLPVVGSEIGAVGERIRAAGAGWAINPLDAPGILELFKRIRNGDEDWTAVIAGLTRWQQETAQWDVAAMSAEYVDIYQSVQQRRRTLLPAAGRRTLGLGKRIALLVRGHYPYSMPSSHVRIATQVAQSSGDLVEYVWIDGAELVRSGIRDFDGVVLCRNAGEPAVLSEVARQCKLHDVPLVLDLDDDLLNVPPSKDPVGGYAAAAPALRELLTVASLTTVSTAPLLSSYEPHARQLRLVPNRLDPKLWFSPLPEDLVVTLPPVSTLALESIAPAAGSDAGPQIAPALATFADQGALVAAKEPEGPPPFRLLYMGSPTHAEDLALIMPAIERLRDEYGVTLHIVGITTGKPPRGVAAVVPPSSRYDNFILWFRSLAKHFDLAVAPLVDTRFNRAKSALKFMEYAAAGLPVVASRVEPYTDVIRDGIDGLLASNDPESWFEAIHSLMANESMRRTLIETARVRAEQEFACRNCVFDQLPWDQWRNTEAKRPRSTEALSASPRVGFELEADV